MKKDSIDKKLLESEKLYRMLFDHSMDGIMLTDPREGGKILSANPAVCHMLGWTEEELIGKGWRDIIFDPEDPALSTLLDERARSGSAKAEITYRRRDGTTFPGEVSTAIFFDTNGEPRVVAITRDVTERKQAEAALCESESRRKVAEAREAERKRLFDVLDKLPAMISLLTPDHHVTFTNRSYREKFGEPGGRHCYEYCFGNTGPCEFCEAYKVLETGQPHNWEVTTPDGSVIDVYNIPFTDIDGSPMILEMNVDVTRRKKAEEILKKAHNNLEEKVKQRTEELEKAYYSLKESERGLAEAQKMAHIGSWELDLVTGTLDCSDEMYRIFGLDPEKFGATYDALLSHIHPEDRDCVNNAVMEALSGKAYSIDYRIILANGEERIIHEQGKVIFDEKNIPVRMFGTAQDVTERKRTEETLEKIEETRIKEIHHRIKNNLQVISSLLSLEAEKFTDSKILETFKESQNRIASMALIHEELYKGDKIDTLEFGDYLRKLTADLFLSYNLRNENINLSLDFEQVYLGLDTAIPLGIIVNELVSNSLKHAFPDGNKWEISISLKKIKELTTNKEDSREDCECSRERDFQYTLTIADNGRGIPEGIDFRNTDSLGLQLVNILVEQIEGCIELGRNQGTEFCIWFNNI
ncbi:PAS domain S-box protein [Methanosarcina sp. MSH10X1]|uniref:PAS domain-containing sensor histidine kinase n=1 Tax=Methanosarcina sp. MSH10X1 TaxID=2507075 RepID=UPI000FFC7CFB|nr:PAS domain S-box protein [Methanosarcina sp. MSH10X1]RXA21871.1 PAS domain S-box protein [Methanosarcina sp. MSH10X1]